MSDVRASSTRQILGLRFFNGDVDEAVAFMHRHGGYLVAPSGTCFARLREDEPYRRAVLSADLAIADSGLMVLTWRLLRHEKIQRISGLKYLKQLLRNTESARKREVFWIFPPNPRDRNCWIVRARKLFQSTGRIVMSRRGTVRKSKIEIFLR